MVIIDTAVFKLRTAFEFKKSHRAPFLEKSYYDHILLQADSLEGVACCLWQNAVRKKLWTAPLDCPFSGSQTIEWMQRAKPTSFWSAPWNERKRQSKDWPLHKRS